jgi:hypothetical protein
MSGTDFVTFAVGSFKIAAGLFVFICVTPFDVFGLLPSVLWTNV